MGRVLAALVRHGDYHQLPDTPSAHQPFPLTPRGEEQARAAAGILRGMLRRHGWQPVLEIDSSMLLRAWQTADIIADQLAGVAGSELHVDSFEALAERGLGSAANLSMTQIRDVIHRDPRFTDLPSNWKADSHYRLPLQGAESLLEAGERVAMHLRRRIMELGPAGDADRLKIFVGHGAALRHAAYHLGVLDQGQIAKLSMYHGQPVVLEFLPGGLWRHVDGDWKLRTPAVEELD
jgi:2,3-bisphosphoglycerate-dependent phosphoglycerate mutase